MLAAIPESRAFVRPSGTEDILRLYVEAPNFNKTLRIWMLKMEKLAANILKVIDYSY